MRVKDIMNTPVYAITPGEPISRARNLMLRHRISRLLVILHDEPVGMLTKSDIGRRLDQAEPQWRRRPIDQIPVQLVMTKSLISIYPDATLSQACELLLENDIGGLAVSGEDLYGIITKWDVIKYFSQSTTNIRVSEIMSDFVAVVHRRHSLSHILQTMEAEDVDRVVVLEYGGRPVGMITNSNLTFACMSGAPSRKRKMVELPILAEDIMSTPLITIRQDGLAVDAARLMVEEMVTSIIVVDEDEAVVGILNQESILQATITIGEQL
ncbi:MAG: CBS domain-containing protein [Methanosarcinales archaeon]|nr:CBS domain-containing protein [Methanosarcinales archaeon]